MSGAWLLNLDAELEVEGRAPYPGPLMSIKARPALVTALTPLVPQGDEVLQEPMAAGSLAGRRAFAWSPTPSAASLLREAGATLVRPLPLEILRAVMSRGFAAALGLHFAGAAWQVDAGLALEHVGAPSPSGRWLVRRAFGFAGKARRVFATPAPADVAFVRRAADDGGVLIEPFVQVAADFGLHGFVGERALLLGEPVRNEVGAGGVFRGSRRAASSDFSAAERKALVAEAQRSGEALRAAGYRGPFGIDAFRYTLAGREGFQPCCEVNARYSMAWAVGMGERRPDLDACFAR